LALVTSEEIYRKAESEGYAVGGYETYWLEAVQVFADAAEEARAPILIQVTPVRLRHFGIDYFEAVAKVAALKASVPLAIHLDHGFEFEDILQALRHGFTSVMIDASNYSLEENIGRTRRVVEAAHPLGVSVEAELGLIGGKESGVSVEKASEFPTVPEEARDFVEETGVDSLAVAIGNASGVYREDPRLDLKRLEQIRELVSIPLVLHGGSGIPEDQVKAAVGLGIRKVNIATQVKKSFMAGLRAAMAADGETLSVRRAIDPPKERVKEAVRKSFDMLGCVGKG
jgi:fructose-bisphosphate aldolase class II